jgi:hypothetical protein
LYLSPYDNFTWGPCPALSAGRRWSGRQPRLAQVPARTVRAKAGSKPR